MNNSFSKIIKGKVVNEKKDPLTGVNVYFGGNTIGTITDINGNFTLDLGSKLNSILGVSYMGYRSEYLGSFDPSKE